MCSSCRFSNCQHIHEPGCVVRGDWERYPFYLEILELVGSLPTEANATLLVLEAPET